MPHREPEYRRRIRQKAEEDQRRADRERQEATQDTRIESIVRSVERIVQQVERYSDENSPDNKSKRCWEKAEVLGLWAAAFVGVAAIWSGSHDSAEQRAVMAQQINEMRATRDSADTSFANQIAVMHEQTKAMQGQLDQMSLSQRPWIMLAGIEPIALSSDNLVGVDLSAKIVVKNVGHSPAQNVSVTADLLIGNIALPLDQGMVNACYKGSTAARVIPGRPVFPDQTQNINGDTPSSFPIDSNLVWAARDAQIKSALNNKRSPERAKEWANAIAKFPFYAPIFLVGCINYRSSDNTTLYQTSFMFEVDTKEPFPLLSKGNPIARPPTPAPGDPDNVAVHARELQRTIPGSKVMLGMPLYGTFAN